MSFSFADVFWNISRQIMSGVADASLRHMEVIWAMLAALSFGAVTYLVDSIQVSLAVLKRASAGHHMLVIRGDHEALTVKEDVEYF